MIGLTAHSRDPYNLMDEPKTDPSIAPTLKDSEEAKSQQESRSPTKQELSEKRASLSPSVHDGDVLEVDWDGPDDPLNPRK